MSIAGSLVEETMSPDAIINLSPFPSAFLEQMVKLAIESDCGAC